MFQRLAFFASILLTIVGASAVLAQGAGDPSGVWLTQAGDARVKVTKCGGGICGVIVWLREPIDSATQPPHDRACAVLRHAAGRPGQMVGPDLQRG